MSPFELIAQHTERPVCAASLPQQLQDAAAALFGPVAVALVEEAGGGRWKLHGLVDAQRHAEGGFGLPGSASGPPALGTLAFDAAGADICEIAIARFEPATPGAERLELPARAVYLPWPLGGFFRYAFLLLGEATAGPPPADPLAGLEFVLIATSLSRKAEHAALIEARSWIDEEIDRIAALQRLLRPDSLDQVAGARFAVRSEAFRLVGGDYFDIARFPHRRPAGAPAELGDVFGVSVADVSGHGPSAAVEAAMLDAVLRTYRDSRGYGPNSGPHDVLTYLNRHLFTRRPRASFVTALFAVYEPAGRLLRYACAGHPPPLLRPACGASCELPVPGEIPIRVLPDYTWTACERALHAGDTLVFYTDGITEARSPAGEAFGRRRLLAALDAAEAHPDAVLAAVKAALTDHCAGRPASDDRTLIAVQVD